MRRALIAIGVVAVSLPTAGCGSSDRAAEAPKPHSLAAKCEETDGVSAHPLWLTTSDGLRLYAIEAGSGSVAVVLVHESPADVCGWVPFIPSLVAAHLRVLAVDLRGFGDSQTPKGQKALYAYDRDLRAAIAHERAGGAKRVFLLGASFGGAAVLNFAPRLDADGVISLSGETSLPNEALNGLATAPRLDKPLLIVGSRHDHWLPVGQARALIRRAGSPDKQLALYPGAFHGWDIVKKAPYAAKARALILGWIRARST
jgi:alpha-beta hydrolase superfamily lysophospholipase